MGIYSAHVETITQYRRASIYPSAAEMELLWDGTPVMASSAMTSLGSCVEYMTGQEPIADIASR